MYSHVRQKQEASMNKDTVTFRIDADKRKALDSLAASLDRDRSYILNEAISTYLDMHNWQIDHIKEGVRQADKGQFAKEKDVAALFAKWRK